MALILTLISLMTGTTKCVSVCGINSAQVAQPRIARNRAAVAAYFAAIFAGSAILVVTLAAAGRWLIVSTGLSLASRTALLGIVFVAFGIAEVVLGPWLLPHVAWAVPRSWPNRGSLGLPAFGLVRGLAIFNHSPFASMHMWIVALVLVPDAAPPLLLVAAFGLGLAFWSLLYGATAVIRPGRQDDMFRSLTERTLLATPLVARLDGLGLVVVGLTAMAIVG